MRSRILILVVLAAVACDRGEDPTLSDPNFYASLFYEEAAKHGITGLPSQSSIPITFVKDQEIYPSAGYATYDPPTVRLAETIWSGLSPLLREQLVFHEFGHAALKRVHTNERLPNCEYKSLMLGGQIWVYTEGMDDERKEWYIEELFNPSAPYPSWAGTAPGIHADLDLGVIEELEHWEYHGESGTTHTGTADESIKVAGKYALSIQADPAVEESYSVTSDTYRLVQGTNDWIEINQKIHCYPNTRPNMRLFLGIDGIGTGDVWFDEIKVGFDRK